MTRQRNNLFAGLFVVAGIAVAFTCIILLSDLQGMFTPMYAVRVGYKLSDGLLGLKQGATVTIGNSPIGTITEIADQRDANDPDRVIGKIVTFEIPKRYTLYDNAIIELNVPPLGTGTTLNIKNVGFDPKAETKTNAEGQVTDQFGCSRLGDAWAWQPGDPPLTGGVAGSMLTANLVEDMGIGDLQRRQIQGIIANVNTLTTQLTQDPEKLRQIVDDLHAMMADARAFVAQLKTHSDTWFARLDSITDSTDKAVGAAKDILQDNQPVIKDAVAKARNTMDNAEVVTGRIRNETIDKITAMLDKANASFDDIKTATSNLSTLVVTQRPVIERMIANLRLTSDQLKLTAVEVRRSPWRLLYKPTEEELDTDNLYNASRSFSLAATTLESTADSLNALMNRYGREINTADPDLKLILQDLHATFEKFSQAETDFWKTLEKQAKK